MLTTSAVMDTYRFLDPDRNRPVWWKLEGRLPKTHSDPVRSVVFEEYDIEGPVDQDRSMLRVSLVSTGVIRTMVLALS